MKKCCRDFYKTLLSVHRDRTFEYQCPTCGKRGYQQTTADGGLDSYGRSPEEVMSNKIIQNAMEGRYGEKVFKVAINSMKTAAKVGKKGIHIRVWDRYNPANQ